MEVVYERTSDERKHQFFVAGRFFTDEEDAWMLKRWAERVEHFEDYHKLYNGVDYKSQMFRTWVITHEHRLSKGMPSPGF